MADDGFLLAARYEPVGGNDWAFYFINNTDIPLESLVLEHVDYEWGDMGNSQDVNRQVGPVKARGVLLAWRDDSDAAELRTDLTFQARSARGQHGMTFEFPKLYRNTENSLTAPLLGKARHVARPSGAE
jgi:hypothetical protein